MTGAAHKLIHYDSPYLESYNTVYRGRLRFHTFDVDYLRRLAEGDAVVEAHFTAYFGELLRLKLRVRLRSPQLAEDVRQETLLRVLQIVRKKGGIEQPERFGAFVASVSNNVMKEMLRADQRDDPLDADFEPPGELFDFNASILSEQNRRRVQKILDELPEKDRELLRLYFLEECDRSEICRRLGVSDDYFRVLLHRAKARFRSMYTKRYSATC